jgi:kynurenine 3-monooxygenase
MTCVISPTAHPCTAEPLRICAEVPYRSAQTKRGRKIQGESSNSPAQAPLPITLAASDRENGCMTPSSDITIAGAGLAGTLLAALLAQSGFRVRLLERRADMRSSVIAAGRSINLALAERGIQALRSAGLAAAVLDDAIAMPGRMVHHRSGQSEFFPYATDGKRAIYSVHRARLNQRLLDAAQRAGAAIEFETQVRSVDLKHKLIHSTHPKLGERSESFALLIGADGAGSSVREALDHAFGKRSEMEPLEHSYKELSMPPIAGEFVLSPHALHIWPRVSHMMIALPNPDRSFTCTLFLPNQGTPSFAGVRDQESLAELFGHDFDDAIPVLPNYLDEYFQNPTGWLGTLKCEHWVYQDSVALLGDAAHAIVPFHGQGMNCAFEDCLSLHAHLLQARGKEGFNPTAMPSAVLAQALSQYQHERMPNARAIAAMAVENYREMRDEVADPRFRARKQLEKQLAQTYPEIFLSRYSMVTFTSMPYREAFERGTQQRALLDHMLDHQLAVDDLQVKAWLNRLEPLNERWQLR